MNDQTGEQGRSRAARKPRPWLARRVERRMAKLKIEPFVAHAVGVICVLAEIEAHVFTRLRDLLTWILGIN